MAIFQIPGLPPLASGPNRPEMKPLVTARAVFWDFDTLTPASNIIKAL